MNDDYQISVNFRLGEFFVSKKAEALNIINRPKSIAEQKVVLNNIVLLVTKLLQPLRGVDGRPIVIDSGYRTVELNRAVGGVYNSQHLIGQAVDIYRQNPKELIVALRASHLVFDQAITYRSKPHLLHLSYKATGNRNMVLYRD